MPSEGRKIGCCGASTWSRVIAWFQIISYLVMAGFMIIGLVRLSSRPEVPDNERDQQKKSGAMAFMIGMLVFSSVGVAFGVLLLVGTNQRRPNFLKSWIICTSIVFVVGVIVTAMGSASVMGKVILCAVKIVVQAFFIWIVYTLKKEIEMQDEKTRDQNG